ncbi:MAG: MFS transporter [Bacteroidaceae bacterium]|nr:MFS transporter [Bacteroidaceae bacterium]
MKKTNWRWWLCSLLFVATLVNYLDRQVLSLTWKDFIAPEFHWSNSDYGNIAAVFSIFYALISLFAGRFIDWAGTKRGYLIAIFVWSLGACLHALCGWATIHIQGLDNVEALRLVESGSAIALAISSTSFWLFLACRMILAVGESGNFPAAIKVVAEYFPKKDRALATSIFNAGASIGALAAPISIPFLARAYGWEAAFVIIGALGFIWMFFWNAMYEKPAKSSRVNAAELAYINQDNRIEATGPVQENEPSIPYLKCFTYRQTWSFIVGKFFTDGAWWFFLFWAPAYFSDQYGYRSDSTMAALLIFVLYLIVTVVSISAGGYLPKYFVERRGMEPYSGRMRAMLMFAFLPLTALFAQYLGQFSAWWPAVIIGLAGAGHQSWSANLYSTIGDMFPKSTVATITGIGTMAGGIASFAINMGAGYLFDYSAAQGSAFHLLGFEGKEAGYMIIFCYCAVGYLLAWLIMKSLVPRYKKIEY